MKLASLRLVSFIFVISSWWVAHASECKKAVEASPAQLLKTLLNAPKAEGSKAHILNEAQAIFKVAEFMIKKLGGKSVGFPAVVEMPQLLGRHYVLPYAQLSAAQQKSIRKYLIQEAIKSHRDLRETLLERLTRDILVQFKKDLSIPSLSRAAKSLGTTATELAEWVFEEESPKKAYEALLTMISEREEKALGEAREMLIRIYIKRAREYRRTLTLNEFYYGVVEAKPEVVDSFTLEHLAYLVGEPKVNEASKIVLPYIQLFDSLESVYVAARRISPQAFDKVLDKYVVNVESHQAIVSALKKHRRVLLVAAKPSDEVHEEFFANLIHYAELKDAFIIVYPEAGQPKNLDPDLIGHPLVHILHSSIEVTPWLKFNSLPLHFKRDDPVAPFRKPSRGGPRGQMQVVGHPQMRDEIVSTADNHINPHRVLTTGAVTKAWYASKYPIGGVTDDIARDVHLVGALLIEKDRDDSGLEGLGTPGTFHVRHIEWSDHSKSFIDLGQRYSLREQHRIRPYKKTAVEDFKEQLTAMNIKGLSDAEAHQKLLKVYLERPTQVSVVRPEYYAPGDKHFGGEDHFGMSEVDRKIITQLRPKRVVYHDVFDGKSVSNWEATDPVLMAEKAISGQINLEDELNQVVAGINEVLNLDPEVQVIIVEANHNNWLTRMLRDLDRQKRVVQPINQPLVAELSDVYINQKLDPLEYYVKYRSERLRQDWARGMRYATLATVIDPARVQFLPKGASLKAGPVDFTVELGEHGHNSGGFGSGSISLRTTAGRSYSSIAYGHTHSPGRNHRAANAGASISPRQDYAMAGPSATGMGFILVYDDGIFQVHHYNPHSRSFALEDVEPLPPDEFFYQDVASGIEWPRIIEKEEGERNLETLDQFRRVSRREPK